MPTDLVEPDDVLLTRVRGGGSEAYDLLFARHAARARRVARAVLDDTTEVDDVVSEAFAAVLGALQRGKGPTEGFEGYLVSTVRHEAYRANRRRTKQRSLDDRDDEPAADPFVGREDEELLRAAFGSLPPFARDVLWLTEVEGRSHADIARSVGSTRQAIATPRGARQRCARLGLPRRPHRLGVRRASEDAGVHGGRTPARRLRPRQRQPAPPPLSGAAPRRVLEVSCRARSLGAVQRAPAHGAVHGGRGRSGQAGDHRRLGVDARPLRGLRVARRRRCHRGRHADDDSRRRAGARHPR